MSSNTIRNQWLAALKTHLELMTTSYPVGDPYSVNWTGGVFRETIEKLAVGKLAMLGVYDGPERVDEKFPLTHKVMRVTLEFHIRIDSGQTASARLNEVLGDIQRHLYRDRTLGGLVVDMREVENTLDIEYLYDKVVQGALFLDVSYRHKTGDPREVV